MDMARAVKVACDAMEGIGTKDKKLIEAVAQLDPLQIAGLRQAYKSRIGRELDQDVSDKTSGRSRDGLLAVVRGPLLQDAYTVRKAIKGLGTNEAMLNDVLIGRSNADMCAIKVAYQQTFGRDMVADVKGDLSLETKTHFQEIMAAARNEDSFPVHLPQVEQDVNTFHKITEEKSGKAKSDVCDLLIKRNDEQIRAIAHQYQQRFQKPLDVVISKEFNGHMKDALLLQLARATGRATSDATQLEDAMKGIGTKNELLSQIVVRVHWNRQHCDEVKRAYQHKYHKGLVERVNGETSGDHKRLLDNCLA
jgi:annexin A7/11